MSLRHRARRKCAQPGLSDAYLQVDELLEAGHLIARLGFRGICLGKPISTI